MSFISYAQNFEDVMLWRALKHIKNGFYIDVGAAWPEEHSVTKAFYDTGWSGVNIEPNPSLIKLLVSQRPRDINLELAVGEKPGLFQFNYIDNTGLSSLDNNIINTHIINGYTAKVKEVEVTVLKDICSKYTMNRDVHFMKIDVEGYEKEVLLGNDWKLYRPWVVVVESTLPLQQTETYGDWEDILLKADYLFAYADGLNRFYISKEHNDLLDFFKYPPNVFDAFNLPAQARLEKLNVEMASLVYKYDLLNQQNMIILNSASWRLTRPFRVIKRTLKLLILRIKAFFIV